MKKKSKFVTSLIILIILLVVSYLAASLIRIQTVEFSVDYFSDPIFIGGAFFSVVMAFLPFAKDLFKTKDIPSNSAGKGKTKDGKEMSQYYDSRFITEDELRREPRFRFNTWETLKNEKDGIVIRSLLQKGKYNINFAPNTIHTMIIGTTGSGKTTLYVDPTIRILSKTQTKPCMVITDPKGELFNKHSLQLRDSGYRVHALDLRQPFNSTRWNPMSNAYKKFHESASLEKQVRIHKGDNPKDSNLRIISDTYNNEWYEFQGVAFPNAEILRNDLSAKKQVLLDEAENQLREIASSVVTVESKHDASWERGSQDFLYGLMLAMLEDSLEPEKTGMTEEKFNFYNLAKMALYKDPDPDNQYQTLREYCDGRGQFSKVSSLTSAVINNAPNTSRSYMGVLQPKLAPMQDMGVCYATSFTDLNLDDFDEEPTALFIKVPDEKESRHFIATLLISQLYQKMIERANKTVKLELPRPVHFILDEFANLPKIDKMDNYITVGRSRKIWFHLVIQSYSQLDNKYGKETAETIKGNCNVQIYIGTDDQKTKEDFSKLCGDISLTLTNESKSKSEKAEQGSSKTTSTQVVTRPLIIPYELGQLPKNTVVVKCFQENPVKTELTPYYKIPFFDSKVAAEIYSPAKPLDEGRIFFDMKQRNKNVLQKRRPSFDDFDF